MLTGFQNFFTGRFTSQSSLTIPPI